MSFNASRTLIQGAPGRDGQVAMERHHHTSTISLGNQAKKEMDRPCLHREAKHGRAIPLHFASIGTSQPPSHQGEMLEPGRLREGAAAPHWRIAPEAPGMAQPKPLPKRTAGPHQGESWPCRCFPGWPGLREVISHGLLLNTLIK